MTEQLGSPRAPEPDFTQDQEESGDNSNGSAMPTSSSANSDAQPVVLTRAELYDESWMTSFLRPLLVVILISCVNVVLLSTLVRIAPPVAPGFFTAMVLLTTFAAIVGAISTTVLAQPGNRIRRSAGLRAAEIALFLAATRLVVWFMGTGLPTLQEALMQPLTVLTDPLFLVCGFLVALSWMLAVDTTDNLTQLGLRGDELYRARSGLDMHADSMRGAATDRRQLLQQFLARWIGVGLVMIFLAAMLRRELLSGVQAWGSILNSARQDVELPVVAAVVLYFLVGLILISQGRLAMLRARWALDRLAASETVARRWSPMLIVVLGIIAIGALFLPLGGTFLLATILTAIINFVFTALMIAYQLIIYFILWVVSLFSGEAPPEPPPLVQPTPPPAEMPPPVGGAPLLPEWVGGGVFWIVVAALVLYAAVLYFRDKGASFGWLRWLWQQLRLRWGEFVSMVRPARARTYGREEGGQSGARDFFGWLRRRKPTDPDALVRYYYFSTLDEAQQAGIARQAHETPLRFAQRLEAELAQRRAAQAAAADNDSESMMESDDISHSSSGSSTGSPVEHSTEIARDAGGGSAAYAPAEFEAAEFEAVDALTDAFVAQRYGGKRADRTLAERLQEQWRKLQAVLRRRTRK